MLSPNTLHLLLDLLNAQQFSVRAGRAEIDAVLAAKEELEAAIAATDAASETGAAATNGRPANREQRRAAAKKARAKTS